MLYRCHTLLGASRCVWYDVVAGFVDMYTLFCVIYVVGFLCHIYGHYRMRFWYPLAVRVFGFSLLSTTLAMLCLAIHYGSYASNGVGTPSLEALGRCTCALLCCPCRVGVRWPHDPRRLLCCCTMPALAVFAVLGRLSQFALCGLLASGLGIVTMRTSVRDNWAAVSLLTLIVAMYFATLIWCVRLYRKLSRSVAPWCCARVHA